MGETSKQEFPYKPLGNWLKRLRINGKQTIAEVSGAVEIDAAMLTDIEQGKQRPSEDILLLLISYFSLKEDDANKLWDMAGYEGPNQDSGKRDDLIQQPVVVLPMDARIVYTDLAHIETNKYGVTINFMQASGINGKPLAVSRVGMSHEHAEKLLGALQKALQPQPPKLLPAPETNQNEPTDS